ncbi:MAG TPA: hypothetical protein VLA66_04700, partial [Thermoanaerobaculia bacterium]|nr:hypothetical protein [Thermoanaerobaculia bacterium]
RLTLRDGHWIETLDGWRIEGERIVFRTRRGAWRSLPLAELAPPVSTQPARGARLEEDPWGPLPEIPQPGPLPLPAPGRVRPRALPRPPVCVLANAAPGGPPELLCEPRPDGAGATIADP